MSLFSFIFFKLVLIYSPYSLIFIDISFSGLDSDAFSTKLLKQYNVAVTPGKVFDNDWDTHIRISLGGGVDEFKEGVSLFVDFYRQQIAKK